MEFKRLTDDEIQQWEALADNEFGGYEDASLDDEARSILAEVCESVAICDNDDDLIHLNGRCGAEIQKWMGNPTFARFLVRAYEHFVAGGSAGACCNLGAIYLSGDGARVARPLPAEGLPGRLGGRQRGRAVDRAHGAAERRGLLLRDVPQRVADQVDDAAPAHRPREHGREPLAQPGHAVGADVEDVLHAAGPELVEHLHPAVGALGVVHPQAQDVQISTLVLRVRETRGC